MQSLCSKLRFAAKQTVNNLTNLELKPSPSSELKILGYSVSQSTLLKSRVASSSALFLNRRFSSRTSLSRYSRSHGVACSLPSYGGLSAGLNQSAQSFTSPTRRNVSTVSISQDGPASSEVPQRVKFKRLDKTARHIMQIINKEAVDEVKEKREIPDIKPGYIVQLKVEVPENKRRVSIIKGIVIARRNAGLNTTFRIRRLVAGVGIESLFPLYSPNIKEIKVVDKKKVRRAKLYYLRDKMNALKKQ